MGSENVIYLDYSATTPVDESVLDTYVKVTKNYVGNPNSLHKLGFEAGKLIDEATAQIKKVLSLAGKEIIYTSGATEANNLAIFGVCYKYQHRGKHIITTHLEHKSVLEPLKVLEKEGYEISYVSLNEDKTVNLEHLKSLIREDTILVSIAFINSEVGVKQDLIKIKEVLAQYPKIIFHSDITQGVGKIKFDLNVLDLASFSAQKFYGMKGIGGLIKNTNLDISPIIYGGKSTTRFRAGTPPTALIVSMAKALRLAYDNIEEKYKCVEKLNQILLMNLRDNHYIVINSPDKAIPHIVNFSVLDIKAETLLHALEEEEIYISTKTACSSIDYSESVYNITGDKKRAEHSLRVSISHLTSKEEILCFVMMLEDKIERLRRINS